MNDGAKLLIYCFAGAGILCAIGCIWDNTHPSNRFWTGEIAHVEIHIDRPIEEIAKEVERENETSSERFEREGRENAEFGDFETMT